MPSSPPVIDLERLLAPFPGDSPTGQDLSASGVVSDLKELRRADEVFSADDLWQAKELKQADWPKAIKLATETLATRSKDLYVAAYLVESITKVHGLNGLRDGLRLIREMHVRYWDSVYPPIEEGDVEFRSGALSTLDSVVPLRVREARVTKSMAGVGFTQLEWEDSKVVDELERSGTEESKRAYETKIADGKITGEQFRKAVATTPKSFYEKFISDLDECWDEVALTNQVIEEKYREAGASELPVLYGIKKTLEVTRSLSFEIERLVGQIRPKPIAGAGGEEETPAAQAGGATPAATMAAVFTGPGVPLDPMDREDALRRLNAVASYFRKHEPHSPVAYLVDRAVAWGNMPLEKWLEEVVKDAGTLGAIRELLGIKAPE